MDRSEGGVNDQADVNNAPKEGVNDKANVNNAPGEEVNDKADVNNAPGEGVKENAGVNNAPGDVKENAGVNNAPQEGVKDNAGESNAPSEGVNDKAPEKPADTSSPQDPQTGGSEPAKEAAAASTGGDPQQSASDPPESYERCDIDQRLKEVRERCARYPELSKPTSFLRHIKVDDKHKVILCLVRKAASTSIHNMLHLSRKGTYAPDPDNCGEDCWENAGILPLDRYSQDDITRMLRDYHKVMVVRHPFDRFVSCWNDKFRGTKSSLHNRRPGLVLIEHVRNVSVNVDIDKEIQPWMSLDHVMNLPYSDKVKEELQKPMSLEEFTQLVAYYERIHKPHDSHWRQMHQVCQPCYIQYDYMVRVETLAQDSKHILKKLNLTEESFPQLNSHRHPTHPNRALDKALPDFGSVSDHVMDTMERLYKTDMDLFGYTWDRKSLKASCSGFHNATGNEQCC